ncbi:MAG: aspartate carbamoyltransferase [Bacillota bacterium]
MSAEVFHCLRIEQYDRKFLDDICELADAIRFLSKSKQGADQLASLLSHKRAMLYFVQPSTRTFLSFQSACQILGMKTADVRDTNTSSEVKGESEADTVRTFSSYYDVIIMRHHQADFARHIANVLNNSNRPVPVINGGSGKDQHPTQALLDVYTLIRSFKERGGVDGKKIAFVGDLFRGRTVRSLACLLTKFQGVRQYFVAPRELQIGDDILSYLDQHGVSYALTEDFRSILSEVDVIYMTRLQDEWDVKDGGNTKSINLQDYSLTKENMNFLQPHTIVMHPLPRRQEISTDLDNDPRAMYWRQMRNGMFIRAALLAMIFDVTDNIFRIKETLGENVSVE